LHRVAIEDFRRAQRAQVLRLADLPGERGDVEAELGQDVDGDVAPFTSTLPLAGLRPFNCMRSMASAAVCPATPSALASYSDSPSGSGMIQSAGNRPSSA